MRREQHSVAGPVLVGAEVLLVVQRAWLVAERGRGGLWAAGAMEPVAVVLVSEGEVRAWSTMPDEGPLDVDELIRWVPGLAEQLALTRQSLAARG